MSLDIEYLRQWIGRSETEMAVAAAAPIVALAATLDRADPKPRPGDAIPALWHWLYFLPTARQSELGEDGHPQRGGFLPPIPLPRRMWAAGKLQFHGGLPVGAELRRKSTVRDVVHKTGRTGDLVFLTVDHEIAVADVTAISEEQTIVYRRPSGPGETVPGKAPAVAAQFSRTIVPDPVLLFRYSALTFNSHRIHYDKPYATGVEGYPDLVVHGPLTATLLADLCRRQWPQSAIRSFQFRALRPLFASRPITLCGTDRGQNDEAELWACDESGMAVTQARVAFAP